MHGNAYRPVEEQVIYRDIIIVDIEAGKLDVPIFFCRKRRPAINKESCHAKCESTTNYERKEVFLNG